MSRQHATPLLLGPGGTGAAALRPLSLTAGAEQVSEADIQTLIHAHPGCLPIAEIDPIFLGAVPICTELNTLAGSIDNLLVTPGGLPVLVECKLWRNPQARREVVGQILDYAKELSRWSSADLQREVSRRGNDRSLLELVREAGHDVDEIAFNDALTLNLRRGRFLLLIVGDGIREGVEAIAEYLQAHAGLHFTLGLVEMPIYVMPDGRYLVVPRVIARTHLIMRTVIAAPEGMIVAEDDAIGVDGEPTVVDDMTADRIRFWSAFVEELTFDDPDQPIPKVSKQGYVFISMPAPGGSCWLTAFRNIRTNKVGVFLSFARNTPGDRAVRRVVEDWEDVRAALGGTISLRQDSLERPLIEDELIVTSLAAVQDRERAIAWLRTRTNDFVNVLRPRIRSAVAELVGD